VRVQNGKATRFSKIALGALLVFINLLKLKEVSINNNKFFLALSAMAVGFGYKNFQGQMIQIKATDEEHRLTRISPFLREVT